MLPLIGTKEFIASLPGLLGAGPRRRGRLPGTRPTRPTTSAPAWWAPAGGASDGLTALGPEGARLVWVNSPSNPTGRVLPAEHLAKMVRWARERGAVLASDECYLSLGWDTEPSVRAAPRGVRRVVRRPARGAFGVQAVQPGRLPGGLRHRRPRAHRAIAGDPQARRDDDAHPGPGGADGGARDDAHAKRQRSVYAARRDQLRAALEKAGWAITHSEAGLYLWASRPGHDCWSSVRPARGAGILVAPGEFYGPAGAQHIRVALDRHGRAGGRGRPPPGHPLLTNATPRNPARARPSPRPARRPSPSPAAYPRTCRTGRHGCRPQERRGP